MATLPGVIGLVLGLVGPVSVYCDWVRSRVGSATSISVCVCVCVWTYLYVCGHVRVYAYVCFVWGFVGGDANFLSCTGEMKFNSLLYWKMKFSS